MDQPITAGEILKRHTDSGVDIIKKADDFVLRVSMGGDEAGYYLVYRGNEKKIRKMLHKCSQAFTNSMKPVVQEAADFAMYKHREQKDDSGKPYFLHLLQVAEIISMVTDNANILAAAYLHDTLEDTDTTYEELLENFNKEVADLVMEVTHEGEKDEKGYYFPHLHSKEGIMLKFADRLSNISRMEPWDEKRQKQYLRKSKFWISEI